MATPPTQQTCHLRYFCTHTISSHFFIDLMAAYDTHALKGFAQPWASVDALLQLSFLYVLRKILHFGYAPHFARARAWVFAHRRGVACSRSSSAGG